MLDIDKFADTGQLFDNHYKLIRPLNTEGGTADVWLALDTSTVKKREALDEAPFLDDNSLAHLGLLVAIKIYRPKNALDIEGERRFRDEFMIVFNCNHTNLIHPVHFSIFEETPYLVVPYCQRGSSELMIGNFVNNEDIWKYILDVAGGLNYLHKCSPPIIHQDIKPANILIDDNGNYAITDFGISAKRMRRTTRRNNAADDDDIDTYEEYSGTYAYMAPERFVEGNTPSAESDIWAFGATLYEIITGNVPFGEEGGSAQGDGKVQLSFNGLKIADDIKRLICDCLSKNPFDRPTSQQLLNAGMQKKYINEKKSPLNTKLIIAIVCGLVTAALIVWNLLPSSQTQSGTDDSEQKTAVTNETKTEEVTPKSPDELFSDAMIWANANTADSVKTGIKKLEELAEQDYVPALYELAITYGGMASDADMVYDRKKLLGIKLGNNNVFHRPDMAEYTPSSNQDNEKAIKYYKRIVDLSKPDYSENNMKSAYRLGYYYLCLKNDKKTALSFFKIAKELAIQKKDELYEEEAISNINYCTAD